MVDQWFAILDGVEIGPLPASQIKQLAESGKIGPATPIKRVGMERFIPASKVSGLITAAVEQCQSISPIPGTVPPADTTEGIMDNVVEADRSGQFFDWYRNSSGSLMVESFSVRFALLFMGFILVPMSFFLFSQATMTNKELWQDAFEQFRNGEATTAMVDQFMSPKNCDDYRRASLLWGLFLVIPGIGFTGSAILSTIALYVGRK